MRAIGRACKAGGEEIVDTSFYCRLNMLPISLTRLLLPTTSKFNTGILGPHFFVSLYHSNRIYSVRKMDSTKWKWKWETSIIYTLKLWSPTVSRTTNGWSWRDENTPYKFCDALENYTTCSSPVCQWKFDLERQLVFVTTIPIEMAVGGEGACLNS